MPESSALSEAAVAKTKSQSRLTPGSSALSEAAVAKTKSQRRLTAESSASSEAAVAKKVTKAVLATAANREAIGLTPAARALAFAEDHLEKEWI